LNRAAEKPIFPPLRPGRRSISGSEAFHRHEKPPHHPLASVNIHPSNPVNSGDALLAGVGRWRNRLYRTIARNALSPALFHNLPTNRAVELGTQIAI
jgi:hypothetical protein